MEKIFETERLSLRIIDKRYAELVLNYYLRNRSFLGEYAREIISKIQNMRKDSSFEVMDKIKIYMTGNILLQDVVNQYKDYIMSETLAVEIVFDEAREYTDVTINGELLKLTVAMQ